jgi:hypothetical protein
MKFFRSYKIRNIKLNDFYSNTPIGVILLNCKMGGLFLPYIFTLLIAQTVIENTSD